MYKRQLQAFPLDLPNLLQHGFSSHFQNLIVNLILGLFRQFHHFRNKDVYKRQAQKSRIKAFADYNDYEIVREYEDAGKSGKSIEGRIQFNQMMDDIKSRCV